MSTYSRYYCIRNINLETCSCFPHLTTCKSYYYQICLTCALYLRDGNIPCHDNQHSCSFPFSFTLWGGCLERCKHTHCYLDISSLTLLVLFQLSAKEFISLKQLGVEAHWCIEGVVAQQSGWRKDQTTQEWLLQQGESNALLYLRTNKHNGSLILPQEGCIFSDNQSSMRKKVTVHRNVLN